MDLAERSLPILQEQASRCEIDYEFLFLSPRCCSVGATSPASPLAIGQLQPLFFAVLDRPVEQQDFVVVVYRGVRIRAFE